MDSNDKYLITRFERGEKEKQTMSVYLLNPGDLFAGFGGSRHGLLVRKTASLVVRVEGIGGVHDTEYDIHDKRAWAMILKNRATP